jgi:hypothetical protein
VASHWLGTAVDTDLVARARTLRRARDAVLDGRAPPAGVRDVVLESWRRSMRAAVDPTRPAPRLIGERDAAARLASHRLGEIAPIVRAMLGGVAQDARHIVVICDARGMVLSAEGHREMLDAAAANRVVPGALLGESAVGTNAIGTALHLDHPLQIFSAEHFNRLFHGWTCAAAPVHDPETGALLGCVDVSGNFRTAHPHSVALVTAVARVAEGHLALEAARRDAYLRERYLALVMRDTGRPSALVTRRGRVVVASPPAWLGGAVEVPAGAAAFTLPSGEDVVVEALENGEAFVLWRAGPSRPAPSRPRVRILALGRRRAVLEQIGGRVELSPRHSEILTLLALHPDGLGAEELAAAIHGTDVKAVTIRAEMSRLRRRLGCLLVGAPYRLVADVDADFLEVERLLRSGDARAAARRYTGPLLPRSTVPGIVAARARLEREVRPDALGAPRRRRSPGPNGAGDGRLRLDETRRALAGLAPTAAPRRRKRSYAR